MIYFTADLHLGHASILKLCCRPFSDVAEMNAALTDNWNRRVGSQDTVFILGDLFDHADRTARELLNRLHGKKVLVPGNHDTWLRNGKSGTADESPAPRTTVAPLLYETNLCNRPLTLCHYPLLEWRNSRKSGSTKMGYLIHGHIHNRYSEDYRPLFEAANALNAGVDINGFQPVTFDELTENNQIFKLSRLPDELGRAKLLARRYHAAQLDKAGQPYILHPQTVAAHLPDTAAQTVAWLHDILEDTALDEDTLRSWFCPQTVDAVLAITHRAGEDYFAYIRRAAQNPLAKRVKIEDLRHNMDESRLKAPTDTDRARTAKYHAAFAYLTDHQSLGTP